VISCRLELAKIGVAGDAEKRLRELQVGSPVELKLTLTRPYAERRDADAVADELYRYFAGRRVRGSWYRLTAAEVRERLGQRASLEAPARGRAAAEAAAARERRVAPRRAASRCGRGPRSNSPTSTVAARSEPENRSGRRSCSPKE